MIRDSTLNPHQRNRQSGEAQSHTEGRPKQLSAGVSVECLLVSAYWWLVPVAHRLPAARLPCDFHHPHFGVLVWEINHTHDIKPGYDQ